MKAENRNQLVRGKIVVGYFRASCYDSTLKTFEEMDERNIIIAVTPWFRHENTADCDRALEMLSRCYSNMPGTDGSMMIMYEYKDYRKVGE